jgi:glucose-1-phosphate adenylyltransferase
MQKVISIIMGGGRGTRLQPLTNSRCKPAVPLAGKYRLVDIPLSNCINSGYNQIYVLTQFNTASLHRHIQETFKFDPFGRGFVDILSAEQTEAGGRWYQGTADAVRQNLLHFNGGDDDLFLILSGDQLYRMDFADIVERHRQSGAEVTIAAQPVDKKEVSGYGVMAVTESGQIEEFVEKPTDPTIIDGLVIQEALRAQMRDPQPTKEYCLASMGIYIFNGKTLRESLKTHATDFGKEVIPGLLGKARLQAYIFDGYWEDIGTIRSFFEANLMLTDPVPAFNFFDKHNPVFSRPRYLPASKLNGCNAKRCIVSDGCIISDAILRRSVIGVRSFINEGSRLENVIMMGADHYHTLDELAQANDPEEPPMGIGRNCKISNAIIDKNARIGNNVVISPEGKPDGYTEGVVYVRDGVVIITKNGIIPDNTVI